MTTAASHYARLSPVLGAEVTGLDLSRPLGDNAFKDLHQAWLDHHGLLVVRGQKLQPEAQVAFARRFGPLFGEDDHFQDSVKPYLLPGNPAVYRVSNKVKEGVAQGRARAGDYWHSDVSFRRHPAQASLLHAIEIPPAGGDTMFADMQQAYDALSDAMKALIDGLEAVHDFALAAANSGTYRADQLISTDFDGQNRCIHPVVIRHPETGRKALFVNPGFTAGLVGFEPEESRALLGFLFAHATRHEFIYRHRWAPGDLVIWDNRSLMHHAVVDYEGKGERYMHRVTVIAGQPAH
jgi:taurine dioxygenase